MKATFYTTNKQKNKHTKSKLTLKLLLVHSLETTCCCGGWLLVISLRQLACCWILPKWNTRLYSTIYTVRLDIGKIKLTNNILHSAFLLAYIYLLSRRFYAKFVFVDTYFSLSKGKKYIAHRRNCAGFEIVKICF